MPYTKNLIYGKKVAYAPPLYHRRAKEEYSMMDSIAYTKTFLAPIKGVKYNSH